MTDQLPTRPTVELVVHALSTAPPALRGSATGRLAVMYAEAIDDDDEGDGLFRFGPRLQTTLEALGLGLVARGLLPATRHLPASRPDASRHVSAIRPAAREPLAA